MTANYLVSDTTATGWEQTIYAFLAEKDLSLREVARQAPASIVEIGREFSGEITSLINKRLIIRTGDRLIPYWEIGGGPG